MEEFDAVHGIERRCVVSFGVTKLVGMNRQSIAQHLSKLCTMRVEAAVADADQGRGFLAEQEAWCLIESLAVVVANDARLVVEVDHLGFFTGVNRSSYDRRQPGVLDRSIGF